MSSKVIPVSGTFMIFKPFSYRNDAKVPSFGDNKPIIIFDGECVMCSAFAQFIMRHDPAKRFRLMAAQSQVGAALYAHYGLNPTEYETNILIENGMASFKSDGSIRIFELLGLPWSLVRIARILPLRLRDALYDIIARNRIRWFGKRTCFVPQPTDADRFLT